MAGELDTAKHPEQLRRIAIDPVSRVEGHGKVTILLDDAGHVQQVRLHIVEFRGFEKFVQGRPFWEVPVMVQRLCGICPVSHNLAASKAMDMIVGARRLTPTAEKLRRLMHYGQILQSHALHFFHLSAPDLLFGFDSEASKRNIFGLAAAFPDVARKGVLLRRFGQQVIEAVAGKKIHGTGCVPGGVNKHLAPDRRAALLADLPQVLAWSREAVTMVQQLHLSNAALYRSFGRVQSNLLSLVGAGGALDLYGGVLRAKAADGAILFDGIAPEGYQGLLREEVRSWTYLKFPFFAPLGPDLGWYKVGPLARLQVCDVVPTPLAEAERQVFLEAAGRQVEHAPLAYHWARMIEMLHAAEVIEGLLEDPDLLSGDLVVTGTRTGEGFGIIEAPRGTLIHHYEVDDDDLVTMCNLIVSTTSNNRAMNEAIRAVAVQDLDGHEITDALLNHIEVAIRAFDPCLSCATHALGQMPLLVSVVDAGGVVLQSRRRERLPT